MSRRLASAWVFLFADAEESSVGHWNHHLNRELVDCSKICCPVEAAGQQLPHRNKVGLYFAFYLQPLVGRSMLILEADRS